MKNTPLISIVTPMFNAEKYIEETIESVLSQTYEHWEILIVDNHSTDQSRTLVENIGDPRIQLIKLDFNSGGPARPRNIGVEKAIGEYVAFLDADDIWSENKLEIQMQDMFKNGLNFSDTGFVEINEESDLITLNNSLRYMIFHKRKKNLCRLIGNNFLTLSSIVVKRNFIEKFSEEKDYIAVEDYALWLELFNKKELQYGFVNEKLLKYRIVNNSMSERSLTGKQDIKAMMCSLKFILHTQNYSLLHCFYKSKMIKWVKSLF